MSRPSRRDLLRVAPVAATTPWLVGRSPAQPPVAPQNTTFNGMIVRMQEPQNLEMPFGSLSEWKVPTDRFYVRSHFAVPKIDPAAYKLSVEGHVEAPFAITLDELKKLPPVTAPLTLECAGNGRVFLTPQVRGLQWGHGAVGNADWTGVPLAALLERAKPKAGAAEVVLVGADSGVIPEATPGPIHFDRSLPMAKAMKPEVMIAYRMNGEDLTPSHGFPVRAVVGGWYGMASVKWLTRIMVTDRPHTGFWQTIDYAYFERRDGLPVLTGIGALQPKAAIARPGLNEVVPAGKPYTVFGAAWAGEAKVAKVEVSADGGKTWNPAQVIGEVKPFCWVTWRYEWKAPDAKGPARLLARCTDEAGATQPDARDPFRRTYMINHLIPVDVLVR